MSKIEENELKEINELRTKLASVITETGQYALRIDLLKSDITELTNKISSNSADFKNLLEQEEGLIKRLSEKYGVGSIDFETGEFTPEK